MTAPRRLAQLLARGYAADPGWGWTAWRSWVSDHLADVLTRDLPGYEGISLRYTVRGSPAIIIDRRLRGPRRLFTLAHEVGHVCLGWHGSRTACTETDIGRSTQLDEEEANAFAAELLVPEFWLEGLIAAGGLPGALEQAYRQARASPTTVNLQLSRVLPAGWAFVQVDEGDVVRYSGQSRGSSIHLPRAGDNWTVAQALGPIELWEWHAGWSTTHWLRYPTESPLPPAQPRSAGAILQAIMDDLGVHGAERTSLVQSVNGVCSIAFQRAPRPLTPEALAAAFWQRLDAREQLAGVLTHARCEAFVAQKARELSSR